MNYGSCMTKSLRADAQRNREVILATARAQISAHGLQVPMDTIAEEAGVAVGTLYRHFPTKTALVAAALGELVEQMVVDTEAVADRVRAGAVAIDELLALVDRVLDAAVEDQAVKAAARALGTTYPKELDARARLAIQQVVSAAIADGRLRSEVGPDDFFLLVETAPTDQPIQMRTRWRQLMLAGLTVQSD